MKQKSQGRHSIVRINTCTSNYVLKIHLKIEAIYSPQHYFLLLGFSMAWIKLGTFYLHYRS